MWYSCNKAKTKYMTISARLSGRQIQNLKVGDKIFEGVSSFRYLGYVIDKEGRITEYKQGTKHTQPTTTCLKVRL
jgi:uncharacterized protein YfbU (UPF0304 family)